MPKLKRKYGQNAVNNSQNTKQNKKGIRLCTTIKRLKQKKANNLEQSPQNNNIRPLPRLHYQLEVSSGVEVNLTCHFCDRLVKLLFRVDKNANIFS